MHADGYESLEVEQEIREYPEESPDEYVRLPRALPVKEQPTLESYDREIVICEHELARALEAMLSNEPVRLYGTTVEFEVAAQKLLTLVHEQKCPLKGR